MANVYSKLNAVFRQQRTVVWGFFIVFFALGMYLVRDYGVSVDERQSRENGVISLKYVGELFFPKFIQDHPDFQDYKAPLRDYYDHDYGVAFELPVTYLEHALNLTVQRDIFTFRHLCTFLVCFCGVIGFYNLARRRFNDWRLGLLGALLLVLSPRLFAEFFYNNKDAVFMALFAIATNAVVAFLERPTWQRVGWAALACACTIDVRIMGVILPLATLAMLGVQALHGAYRGQGMGLKAVAYVLLTMLLVVAFWPYLWEAPWRNFAQAFGNMAKFRWGSDVLYAGRMIKATNLPWHYAPVWIGITTPVLYVVGFLVGTFLTLRQLVRRGWRLYATTAEWQDLFFLGLTVAPILAVIVLHSVLYDGWRQLYFVYPSFLMIALRGLVGLGQLRLGSPRWQQWWARWRYLGLGATLLVLAGQIIAMHPLQNTYFNIIAGRHVEPRYELDYWILSYREGLEWIVRHDDRMHIKVSAQMRAELEANRWMLPDYDRDRLEVMEDFNKADYYLTTYRWHVYPYTEYPFEMTTIRRGGQRILSIFRVKW